MFVFGKFLTVLLAVFLVAGCDTTGAKDAPPVTVQNNAPTDITAGRLDSAPGVRSVPSFPPPNDADLRVMTTKLSGGSVEIYDLDADAPMQSMSSVPSVVRDPSGVPLASDPRVTVYPLDGVVADSYPQGAAANWPSAPMGDMGTEPVPASTGGAGVASVYFPYGSAQLSGNDRSTLDSVAETAKFAPVERVSIEGHASPDTQVSDPVEARILNLRESLKRAEKVSETLIQKGVPAEKIKTVGWGDTKASGGGAQQQRRVDILTGGGY